MRAQSIYSAAVISLVELSKSIVDDIEESSNTDCVLGDRAESESEAPVTKKTGCFENQDDAPGSTEELASENPA